MFCCLVYPVFVTFVRLLFVPLLTFPFIDVKFMEGKKETDIETTAELRAIALQYVSMVKSINELKFLRGLDCGEKLDPRDKIRATARRVGLSVPRVIRFFVFSIFLILPLIKLCHI
jgi:hypothetical protein